ncbi:MAG: sterol desaturase family protein [Microscillaceae bacterium]|jgi:sterol desaturase/sphingolipid hydroxylase (fatty acid hydroxylase superfamily)|nr:sterol desaturase family protein [Microscillaceae bacterium]
MLPFDLSNLSVFALSVLAMFAVVVLRYLVVAGVFFTYFYQWRYLQWQARKINSKPYPAGQFGREIYWSVITSFIFAIAGAATAILWQKGYTAIYLYINDLGWLYFGVSILIAMFIHETYYYWLHRWMHQPSVFRWVHKVHHDSLIASPWTAFSFHPLESLLEAIILPMIVLFLPMHPYAIVIHLSIMTLSSVINHLDIEVYPPYFARHWLGKWLIGATHHALHHSQFKYNYGLYFTFWDKWMHTESPQYLDKFEGKAKPSSHSQELS